MIPIPDGTNDCSFDYIADLQTNSSVFVILSYFSSHKILDDGLMIQTHQTCFDSFLNYVLLVKVD